MAFLQRDTVVRSSSVAVPRSPALFGLDEAFHGSLFQRLLSPQISAGVLWALMHSDDRAEAQDLVANLSPLQVDVVRKLGAVVVPSAWHGVISALDVIPLRNDSLTVIVQLVVIMTAFAVLLIAFCLQNLIRVSLRLSATPLLPPLSAPLRAAAQRHDYVREYTDLFIRILRRF